MSVDGARGGPPAPVRLGAGLIMLLGVLGIVRTAYGITTNLVDDTWSSGARGMFLVLNAIVLTFSVLIVVLGYLVRDGRLWAWVTSLVLMPFAVLAAALLTLITIAGDGVPWLGAGMVAVASAALIALTAPRRAGQFFTTGPAPAAGHPAPPTWGPGPGR